MSTAPPFWGACTRTPGASLPATPAAPLTMALFDTARRYREVARQHIRVTRGRERHGRRSVFTPCRRRVSRPPSLLRRAQGTGRRRFQRRVVVVALLRGQTCAVVDRFFSVLLRREISPLPASSILVGAVSAWNSPSIRVEFAAFATATSSTAFLRGGIACGRRCQRPPHS